MTTREPETLTARFRPLDALALFARGLAMGAADVIPGVSGGTIAFITGIYERFIGALHSISPAPLVELARARPRSALRALLRFQWAVMIPLFGGIALSIILFSKLITGLMEDAPGPTYAFFFGLILASSWMPLAHMKGFSSRHAVALVIAGALAWAFVGLRAGPIELRAAREAPGAMTALYPGKIRSPSDAGAIAAALDAHPGAVSTVAVFDPNGVLEGSDSVGGRALVRLNTSEAADAWLAGAPPLLILEERRAPLAWIFCCGALAISAMILPGVSGSFLLLFLGQYHAVYSSIHEVLAHLLRWLGREPGALAAAAAHPWWADFLFVGTFLCGVVVGMGVFSKVVAWLFARAHDVTMAALTGVMLGALRQPGNEILSAASRAADARSAWTAISVAVFVGVALVLGLHFADGLFRSRGARRA